MRSASASPMPGSVFSSRRLALLMSTSGFAATAGGFLGAASWPAAAASVLHASIPHATQTVIRPIRHPARKRKPGGVAAAGLVVRTLLRVHRLDVRDLARRVAQ